MKRIITLLLVAGFAAGCDILGPDGGQATYLVAPNRVACQGAFPQECLLVKERAQDEWQYFYDEIAGFDYQPGYSYVIQVAWREVEDPPTDGSSRAYRLLRVITKEPAPAS